MMTDTISDMLTRIRNAQSRSSLSVEMPYSRKLESIAKVLKNEGYIEGYKVFKFDGKVYKGLNISLKYDSEGNPVISHISRVSKPSLRVYKKYGEIGSVLTGRGIYIISTSRGVMSSNEAKKKRLGGEIICKVY